MFVYVHVCVWPKRTLYACELVLHPIFDYPVWVLGIKVGSPGRAADTLNHRPISAAPEKYLFNL